MAIIKRIASEGYVDEKALYEALKAVENAPQSDWNQTDEIAADYIKNRTHYENIVTTSTVLADEEVYIETFPDFSPEGYWNAPITLENGKTYTVTINDVNSGIVSEQELVCENDELIFDSPEELQNTLTLKSEVIYGIRDGSYHIKIETTEVSTNVKQLDEKYIPDTIARVEDIPTTAIKPFPYYAVNELNAYVTQYKVNLEELEPVVLYSVQESPSTPYVAFALCIICDDGTEKIVTNISTKAEVYYVNKTAKNITLYSVFSNDSDSIDISDKTTSSAITVVNNPLAKWLPTMNSIEYTPTDNYHPATKKYVDDAVVDKANKEDIVQTDWNENDETAVDFIKNRPFYEETGTTKVVLFDGDVELLVLMPDGTPEAQWDEPLTFENGKIYTVAIEDEQQDIVCENNELTFISSTLNDTYSLSADGIFSRDGSGPEGTYHIKIETTEVSETLKLLNEKFIPNTIARISDIPTQVQSDWNQNNEAAVDFIKNRTHYEKEEMTTRTCSFEYANRDNYEKITSAVNLYYKISDNVYSRTTDVTFSADFQGVEYSVSVPTCTNTAKYRYVRLLNGSTVVGSCYIIYADAVTISSVNLTKGIWFYTFFNYIGESKTTYAHITESYPETTIKPLDEKFIPDTIARAEDIPTDDHINALIDAKQNVETDPTVPAWAKAETKPAYTAAEVGALPLPDSAEVGQFFKVSAVENGKVTAVEAVDAPKGGLKLAARVSTTENAVSILVEGLSLKLPFSIALYNAGNNCSGGVKLLINGVSAIGYTGTIGGTSNQRPAVLCWFYEEGTTMQGRCRMTNNGYNVLQWPNIPKVIESVDFTSAYTNDGETKYFQSGTILEIYEGVLPNVSA